MQLIQFYKWGIQHSPADDQIAMAKFWNAHCDVVSVDSGSSIVLNLDTFQWKQKDPLLVKNGRLEITSTNVQPCMIHCPMIFQDLGERWNFILSATLPNYVPVQNKRQLVQSLVKYGTTVIQKNKSYFVFVTVITYASILCLIALGWGDSCCINLYVSISQ